jgi:hypothetical protein
MRAPCEAKKQIKTKKRPGGVPAKQPGRTNRESRLYKFKTDRLRKLLGEVSAGTD